jgi:hypothetical protein
VNENDYLIVYNNDSTCKVKFSDFVFGAENLDFYPDLEELILNVESLNSVVIPGSANWNSVYTTVQLNSAGWESLADGDVPTLLQQVRENGGRWDDVASTVSNTSGSWDSTTALVNQKYSTWDRVAIEFDSSKDNWDSAYNATRDGIQAIYEALAMIETQPWYEYLTINTGDGDGDGTGIGGVNYAAFHSLYTTVELNSASWEESFEISTLSARVDDLEQTIMDGYPFLSLQGGTVTGRVNISDDLYVTGDIRATGDLYVNKNSIVFSDDQTWSSDDATHSKQVFNNYSELSAAFEATTNLVNENNATWEQASNTVLENEIRWNSAYERIQSSASSWDQAVSSVNANRDDWSWAYNTVTTSKIAWDQAADKINASEDEWDYAYRAVLSGSINWNNTSNVVTDNADDWTDTHDIVVAKQSDWDQAYNIVVANSNSWNDVTTRVSSDASKWDQIYTIVTANSAKWSDQPDVTLLTGLLAKQTFWDQAYTIVTANSADWSDQPDVTSLLTKQAFWDQTYTIVTANSSYWSDSIRQLQVDIDDLTVEVGDVATIVRTNSAEWFSPPELTAIVSTGSANWNQTYSWMLSDSPTNNTTYNQSTFVNVSGDAMTGSLSVDADVSVHDNLKIYEGKIIFGDGQVFHGVVHDPLATEELTKQNVKDFKSVYNVVHNNSGDWFSPPELTALIEDTHSVVSMNSASWEESHEIEQFASYIRGVSGGWEDTHNWVEQTSATNNPTYNQATFVNVSGDTMTGDLNVDANVNIHDDINLVEGSIIFGDGQYFHGVTHDPAAIEELNKQHVRDFKDVQSVVSTNSGDWFSPPELTALVNATHLTVNTNSGSWSDAYNTLSTASAEWDVAYSYVTTESATNNTAYNRSTFVNVSGDTMTGPLCAEQNIHILDGDLVFGDDGVAHGHEHTPGEIEVLSKQDLRNLKGVYSTVFINSGNWFTPPEIITLLNSSSANWNYAYDTVVAREEDWDATAQRVELSGDHWDHAHTIVLVNSANWNATYSRVYTSGDNWDSTYHRVDQSADNWDQTHTDVEASKGRWTAAASWVESESATNNSDYNRTTFVNVTGDTITGDLDVNGRLHAASDLNITAGSLLFGDGDWDHDIYHAPENLESLSKQDVRNFKNVYTDVSETSANWNSTYSWIQTDSATNNSDYNRTTFVNVTGDTITGDLDITGKITSNEAYFTSITAVSSFVDVIDIKVRELSGYDIIDGDLSVDGDVSAQSNLYVTDGRITFGDNHLAHGFEHAPEEIEHLTKHDVRDFKSTYSTVYTNSADWVDSMSLVRSSSANWESAYNSVLTTSADWNSTRNSVNTTSANWDSVYTDVSVNSADWNSTHASVLTTSANWNNVYTDVSVNSADWNSTRLSVNTTSANWNNVYTDVSETSGDWNSTRLSVNSTSAEWNSVYSFVNTDSATNNSDYNRTTYVNTSGDTITGDLDITGHVEITERIGLGDDLNLTTGNILFGDGDWDHGIYHAPENLESLTKQDVRNFKNVYTDVSETSAEWNSVYSFVNADSATNNSDYNRTTFVNTSGDTITGDLDITGHLSGTTAVFTSITALSSFVDVIDIKVRELSGYDIIDGDLSVGGDVSAENDLYVTDGKITFGDNHLAHGFEHAPEEIEHLTKHDVRDFKSTRLSVYSTSADWNSTRNSVYGASANWNNVYTDVSVNSADWNSTRLSVNTTSANWNNVYTDVSETSGDWNSTRNSVNTTSANWDNVYTDVSETSASWDSVYNFVNADSATNNSDYNRTTFVNTSGDTITGDLDITGKLTGNEAYFTSITAVSSFVDVIDIKVRELSGYDIIDGDLSVGGKTTIDTDLFITHGDITFGDSGLAHEHEHTPEEIEHLTKYDVRDFKSTRLSVYTTSGDWDSTHASVFDTSASWDSVYSFVNTDSATNNSDYNRTTFVNVTGDLMTGPLSSTDNIHVLEGKIIFGDDGFTHGHDHTPEDLEDFTKRDLRDFKSTYTSVYDTSANWDSVHASVLATSGDWDSTHTSVYDTSANWDSVHASVLATSTNWDNVYTDVSETSAEWDSVYSFVNADSATNNSDYNRTTFVNVTGDTITGDLDIQGHLTGTTAVFTSITALSSVVDVIDIKARELSGYDIIDGNLSVDGDVSVQNDLYITDGRLTFGDNHMVHGFAHAPEEIEDLTKYDVRDFKSTRLSVYTTSGNWDSVHASVLTTSSNWDSVYNWVHADSATNNSDYNRTTYVNVSGDLMTGPLSSTDNIHLLEGELVFGDDGFTHGHDHTPEDIERFTKRDLKDFKSTYTSVYDTSANWDSVHASVLATSAEWDSVYSFVNTDSATNNSDYNRTTYVNVTGDTITGSLSVVENFDVDGNTRLRGDLIVDGDVWFTAGNQGGKVTINLGDNDTDNIVFNADVDSNIAPDKDVTYTLGTTANQWKTLHVQDVEASNDITADNNLYITHGDLIFGDSGYDHGHEHTPEEVEHLNKFDVRNFKSTHLSVFNTSANWDNVYTDVSVNSADWNSTRNSVHATSASWDSVYSFVNADSATNNSDYNRTTYVNVTGDTITGHLNVSDRVELSNDLNLLTGSVLFGDGDWEHDSYHASENLESLTKQDVKNFKNVYTDVSETSASWDSVYSFVNADSATNNSDYNRTTFVNVTGDTITGDLDITGKITSNEAYFTSLTAVSSFVDVIDIKVRELSGYDIIDGDLSVGGDVSAENNLYVTDGKITFGDNHLAHGFVHAPEEIEHLTKYDVRDFKSTYSTVYTNSARWGQAYTFLNQNSANWESTYQSVLTTSANWDNVYTDVSVNSADWMSTYASVYNTSGNWDSTHASVLANSANWDSVYSWVKADSATNNSAYNETTYVNVAGDTITGSLEVQQEIITMNINSGAPENRLLLLGGSQWDNGARIELYGANNSNSVLDGRVHIHSNDLFVGDVYDAVDGNAPWMFRINVDQEQVMIGGLNPIDDSMLSIHGKTTIDGDTKITGDVTTSNVVFNGTGASETLTKQDVKNFKNVYTDVSVNSADWNSTRNSVYGASANWNNVYTDVSVNSADWNSTRNSVYGASANWNNVYTDVSETSASWDSVYSFVNADSATNNSDYNRTTYVNTSGDTITGDLDITGKITSNEAYFTSLTAVSSFVDVIDIKVRELSGYDIIDGDLSVGGDVSAENNLYVTDGKITFGDNHLAHGFVHAPEEIEHLTKHDVRDFKSTYSTVYTNSALWTSSFDQVRALSANWESTYITMLTNSGNWFNTHLTVNELSANWNSTYASVYSTSGNWDSTHASVLANSANWDSVYSWVKADSATNNSAYNHATYVDITGDVMTGGLEVQQGIVTQMIRSNDPTKKLGLYGGSGVDDGARIEILGGNQGNSSNDNRIQLHADDIFVGDVFDPIDNNNPWVFRIKVDDQNIVIGGLNPIDNSVLTVHGYTTIDGDARVTGNIKVGDITFNGTGEIENLTKLDVRNFKSTYTSVYDTSANWDSVHASVLATSADWNSTYTSVYETSALWDSVYNSVFETSGDWNSTRTSVFETSADWNSTRTSVFETSGDWNSTRTSVFETSADWNSVYNWVQADSATNNSDYNRTTYVNVTGDAITGDLDISNRVSAYEGYFTSLTAVSSFVDVIDIKVRELSGYDIIDGDLRVDGDTTVDRLLLGEDKDPLTEFTGGQTLNITNDDDSRVSSKYKYTHAVNVYGTSNFLINGVEFQAETQGYGSNWSISDSTGNALHLETTSVSGYVGEMLADNHRYIVDTQTITLSGLATGRKYAFTMYNQAWSTDNVPKRALISSDSDTSIVPVDQNEFVGSTDGQIVEYVFVAHDDVVTISITPDPDSSWNLYAFSNREVWSYGTETLTSLDVSNFKSTYTSVYETSASWDSVYSFVNADSATNNSDYNRTTYVNVSGDTITGSLSVQQDITIDGTTMLSGEMFIDGHATFNNGVTAENNVYIKGDLRVDGNVWLLAGVGDVINVGESADDVVVFQAPVDSGIVPFETGVHNLGSPDKAWKNVYADAIVLDDISLLPEDVRSIQGAGSIVSTNSGYWNDGYTHTTRLTSETEILTDRVDSLYHYTINNFDKSVVTYEPRLDQYIEDEMVPGSMMLGDVVIIAAENTAYLLSKNDGSSVDDWTPVRAKPNTLFYKTNLLDGNVVDSIDMTRYKSAKYTIEIEAADQIMFTEISMITNGINGKLVEYCINHTTDEPFIEFEVNMNSQTSECELIMKEIPNIQTLWDPGVLTAKSFTWLDAADSSKIELDSLNTFTKWRNSGKTDLYMWAHAGSEPEYVTTGPEQLNNRNVLKFTGNTDFIESAYEDGESRGKWNEDPVVWYLVFKPTGVDNFHDYLLWFEQSTGQNLAIVPGDNDEFYGRVWMKTNELGNGPYPFTKSFSPTDLINQWNIFELEINPVTQKSSMYLNGHLIQEDVDMDYEFLKTSEHKFKLHANWIGSQFTDGYLAEFLVLEDYQRVQTEGYLAWKWGLADKLPDNHTYKNRAPQAPCVFKGNRTNLF